MSNEAIGRRLSKQMKALLLKIRAEFAADVPSGHADDEIFVEDGWNRRTLAALERRGFISVCGDTIQLTGATE